MPSRCKSLCRDCKAIIDSPGYCDKCKPKHQRLMDQRRGTANERGYTNKWDSYSRHLRNKPENQFCILKLPGCTGLTEVMDHIDPDIKPDDPRFFDEEWLQPACKHCNSVKGHRFMKGER